ncbi:hypothetical protein [Modestobacter marinus]|uniref:hypothetical protein n=1 Tax=Modestobacter marinus TaxID=477641 RepID=UPI001C97FC3E|nr:hypothetical protein [Modestobacter marinus]
MSENMPDAADASELIASTTGQADPGEGEELDGVADVEDDTEGGAVTATPDA